MLMLHTGAKAIEYDDLRELDTPEATASHVPIPHHEIVELMRYTLGFHQHEIVEEAHAVTEGGLRYFGLLALRSPYGDYTDTVGLRNSHDKSFPIGIAFGSRVFVCDNLAFMGDHTIRRKHTTKVKRELPALVSEIVAPLKAKRLAQSDTFLRYKALPLSGREADHAIMEMYRRDVIGVQRIADVLEAWERPQHDWGGRTAWRLFNAATFALAGRVAEKPAITRELHTVIDGICQRLN